MSKLIITYLNDTAKTFDITTCKVVSNAKFIIFGTEDSRTYIPLQCIKTIEVVGKYKEIEEV